MIRFERLRSADQGSEFRICILQLSAPLSQLSVQLFQQK